MLILPAEANVHRNATSFRNLVSSAVADALRPFAGVLAGWEGGSVAFDATDEYSDLDLNFLVDDSASRDELFVASEAAIGNVSPITVSHTEPPGRYYKLQGGGEYFLVDLCFFPVGARPDCLDVQRHGRIRPLFDKGTWLQDGRGDTDAREAKRLDRLRDLEAWFAVSQSFVRKAIRRDQHAEALAAFWSYTLRPLVELLRMRYCPVRWDFGMRYLNRDLPDHVYEELRDVMFVRYPADLSNHLLRATEWGERLLEDLRQDELPS